MRNNIVRENGRAITTEHCVCQKGECQNEDGRAVTSHMATVGTGEGVERPRPNTRGNRTREAGIAPSL
jgi:hypothetical protein